MGEGGLGLVVGVRARMGFKTERERNRVNVNCFLEFGFLLLVALMLTLMGEDEDGIAMDLAGDGVVGAGR